MSLHEPFLGKRAAVTGAGGGIGRAVAELLLERGAEVVAADLTAEALEPVAARGAQTVAADLADAAGRRELEERAGPCDYLVIAHGIVRTKPIAETTEAAMREASTSMPGTPSKRW